MALLADEDTAFLRENFAHLAHDVSMTLVLSGRSPLILPGQSDEPEDASDEVKQICSELAALSERIKMEVVDRRDDPARAAELAGDRWPAIVLSSTAAHGRLRYYGLPAGYELSTLVAAIVDLGTPEEAVPDDIAQRLGALKEGTHIQVFVTPS